MENERQNSNEQTMASALPLETGPESSTQSSNGCESTQGSQKLYSVPTTERLARALEEYNESLPALNPKIEDMIVRARNGVYDDFKSESATPQTDLIYDLKKAGATDLIKRVMNDEFAGTREEGEAWFAQDQYFLVEMLEDDIAKAALPENLRDELLEIVRREPNAKARVDGQGDATG